MGSKVGEEAALSYFQRPFLSSNHAPFLLAYVRFAAHTQLLLTVTPA